jgi:hypothetical protein
MQLVWRLLAFWSVCLLIDPAAVRVTEHTLTQHHDAPATAARPADGPGRRAARGSVSEQRHVASGRHAARANALKTQATVKTQANVLKKWAARTDYSCNRPAAAADRSSGYGGNARCTWTKASRHVRLLQLQLVNRFPE